MARRGDELRHHILLAAKDVFLEVGYERASMDAVAARAETSKRSLYAHFESKEKLLFAVMQLVRELYLGQLKTPEVYASQPSEAVALFCARFLQLQRWDSPLRTARLSITAATRLPEGARAYYDAVFAETYARLATYLSEHFALPEQESLRTAKQLIGATVLPELMRGLLGLGRAPKKVPNEKLIARDVDLVPIRELVGRLLPEGGRD